MRSRAEAPAPTPSRDAGSPADIPTNGFALFILIWVAQLVAKVGNGLTPFALAIHVYRQSALSTSVALVTIAGFLPGVLATPLAGVLADRHDRKLLMVVGNAGVGAGLGLLLLTLRTAGSNMPLICACIAFSSASAAAIDPAYRAIVTDLMSPEQYARAGGLVQLASAGQFLISPAVAGLLMARYDIASVVVIDLGLTVLTTAVMLCIPVHLAPRRGTEREAERRAGPPDTVPPRDRGLRTELLAGVGFLRKDRGVLALVWLVTLVTFCMGFLQTLLTPMMLDLTSETVLGAVRSVAAVGMVISSLVIGVFDMGAHHLRYICLSLAIGGTAIILLGATTSVTLIGAFAFVFFVTLPPLNTSVEVLARSAIPNRVQGKVWGLIGFISQFGYVLAYALSGVLADAVFAPLLKRDGALAGSLGRVFGVGPSRGIGLLFAIVGVLLVAIAALVPRVRSLKGIQRVLDASLRESRLRESRRRS